MSPDFPIRKKIECDCNVTWEFILLIFTVTDRYRLIPKDGFCSKNSWFYEKWLRFRETWFFNCMRSKCIFCNFELISSAQSVDPSCIFGIETVYAFVNVRATIVMIRIEVFGLEYVYSVILYFAIASPNSKWPSCTLSAKSQPL